MAVDLSVIAVLNALSSPAAEDEWRLAEAIAYRAHRGVVRRYSGDAYINHPLRVSATVARAGGTDHAIIAAVLHDVVEDTKWTLHGLTLAGISRPVVHLVDVLTHHSDESYRGYIARVSVNPEASAVKRADLLDNMATLPTREPLWFRYIAALKELSQT